MADVTEADREKAARLIQSALMTSHGLDILAEALAEEREKARAPFERLLTLCDAVGRSDHPHAVAYAAVASDIRRAAEVAE